MGEQKKAYSISPQTGQVVNAEGIVVTQNPVGQQRKWIKLWIGPWLKGTTRYITTDTECAFWADLLCEAGDSRFAGYICPGQENGILIGYPLAWYQRLRPNLDVMATFEKFATQGKIAYSITSQNPLSIVVQILNWDKYQAPIDAAQRNRDYRKRKKKIAVSDRDAHRDGETLRNDTASETENRYDAIEDVDVEEEGEKDTSDEKSSSEVRTPKPDDDILGKMARLHPKFFEACSSIILDRARAMRKQVVNPAKYVRGALPSLLQEPSLITEVVFALKINWAEAKDLHNAAMQTYSAPTQTESEPDEPIFDHVSAAMVKNFWEHADRFGWSRQQTRDYLRSFFQVESPKHLSLQDYNAMFKRLHAGPQTPVVH